MAARVLLVLLPIVGFAVVAPAAPADPRPTESGTAGAYSVAEHDPPHCTPRVCVHWVESTADAPPLTDTDGDGTPDTVEEVAQASERALTAQTAPPPAGLGWRAPLADGTRGGDARTDVYLADLGGGHLGYAPFEHDLCTEQRCAGHVLLARGLRGAQLTEIAAHELNHLVTYATAFGPTWLFEATAVWMSNRTNPGLTTWLRFVERWSRATRDSMLSYADKRYGSAVFLQWLERRFGDAMIRDLWERGFDNRDDEYGGLALDAAIRRGGGAGFSDEFARFAAALPEWRQPTSAFADGPAFPDVERVGSLPADGVARDTWLRVASFALYDVPPPAARDLVVTAGFPSGTRGAVALVGRLRGGGEVVTQLAQRSTGGSLEVTLPDPQRFERITAVVVNPQDQTTGVHVFGTVRADGVGALPPSAAVEQQPSSPASGPSASLGDRRPPRVRLTVQRRVSRSRLGRGLPLTVRADESARVTARLDLRRGGRSARLWRASFRLRSAVARRALLRVARAQRRRLGVGTRLRLTLTARDASGNATVLRRRLTIG